MLRHTFVRLLVVVLLGTALLVPASGVAAQATPEGSLDNPFADLGLTQIDITATDDAFDGVPAELDAGRYVVALTNGLTGEDTTGGAFLQIPEGMTTDEFLEQTAPPEATPAGDAAVAEASPAAEGGPDELPPWYYETRIAGGPYANPGETTYAVVDLNAGEWVFWAEYPGAPQAPAPIAVSGEMPADLPVPEADVTVEMSEFAFAFSGPVSAGPQVIELANVDDQPHFIGVGAVPAGTTSEDLLALIESEFSDVPATPIATPEGGLSFENIAEVFGTGDQSGGVTAWYSTNFEPGTHGALCFITDPETGLPHVMLGMIEVFEVE